MNSSMSIIAGKANTNRTQRLKRLLLDAQSNVPFYAQRHRPLDPNTGAEKLWEYFAEVPIVTKQDMVCVADDQRINRRFDVATLNKETTTGSTGQPFTLRFENNYKRKRNWRFLRSLVAAGYRPWKPTMLLTDRYSHVTHQSPSRFYVPVEQPTEAILRDYRKIRPKILYGFLTPLRLLAEALVADGNHDHTPDALISTAEMLDQGTRKFFESVFGCPVRDFYGLTEMGLVAWQSRSAQGYSIASDSILTEFIEDPLCKGRYRIVMTNLELHAAPMIRFDSGDMATLDIEGDQVALRAIEGRHIDALTANDGSLISPYRVTDAFHHVEGLRRFKVVQQTCNELDIGIDSTLPESATIENTISSVLKDLLGADLKLTFNYGNTMFDSSHRKFKSVESFVPKQ